MIEINQGWKVWECNMHVQCIIYAVVNRIQTVQHWKHAADNYIKQNSSWIIY